MAEETSDVIRNCKVCNHPLEAKYRWDLETCLRWVEDCLRWQGQVLHGDHIHYCGDWDELPVDETTPEYDCCHCIWR